MVATLTILAALLLAPAPHTGPSSEAVLSAEFGLDLHHMPRPQADGWQFLRRDYPAYRAVEWQVRLQAPAAGSPLFEDLRSADFVVRFPTQGDVALHSSDGSHSEASDFQPRRERLTSKPVVCESFGGRSSDGVMPYFNLAAQGGGLIVAIGWSGDWRAAFEQLAPGQIRVTAGLRRARFRLPAGEQVRLPAVLLMSYRGTWIDGQNQFRRLLLEHFTPAGHTPMELMPVAVSVHGAFRFNDTSEEKLTGLAAKLAGLKLPVDTYWLDAGWNEGGFPKGQGNPHADPARFPRGLGPVGKAVDQAGVRLLVWFEPERAMRGTWLDREHPDWLLQPSATPDGLRYMERGGFRLLDLGNPAARQWALDSVSGHLREAGIEVYRQDFNLYPAYFWHTAEGPEEVGLRELRHINGLYDFLDQLVRRHPGLILDNCASGGRRLDFEMMRRCVVLWRSDSCWGAKSYPRNAQAMTHGLSHWLPLHGLGSHATDDVSLRSGMGACATYSANLNRPEAVAALRRHLARYLKVRPLFAADFYPLTEWSDDPGRWLAFQFHDPATGEGLVQAFCAGENPSRGTLKLKLQGLDPRRQYTLTDWDEATPTRQIGAELRDGGLGVRARGQSTAVVVHYRLEP